MGGVGGLGALHLESGARVVGRLGGETCLLGDVYFINVRHGWIKRILAWEPAGHKHVGRPKYCWDMLGYYAHKFSVG